MTDSGRQWQKWVVCLLLGALVMIVFWPALHCGFVDYDDPDYVVSNQNIQHGLTWQSIQWALTTGHASNWHPLTWVSHILDFQWYGLQPTGHHLTNLLLHTASSVLLFLLLNRLTGALWRSAFVAAVFALHPLRVESVVWISERKDVLSAFFWMLTIWAYVRYVDEFKVQNLKFKIYYALALSLFALALMAKPMVVTLPFVLLLLDYWPLRRLESGPKFSWRLIGEKIPFLLLAAGDSVATFLVQSYSGAVKTLTIFPLSVRLTNVPVAYMSYLSKNFWPSSLAVFYPSLALSLVKVGGALCFLGAISVLVARGWRARPYLAVGWFWFLGVLVPTIGLVQVSTQAMADRYSYLPSVGLWIMVAWGVGDWIGAHPCPRMITALAGGMVIVACVVLTRLQIGYWQNSLTLFSRAAGVTEHNYLAYYNLARYAKDRGDYAQAISYFKTAMSAETACFPDVNQANAYNNLGYAYLRVGAITNAVADFAEALALRPAFPEAYYNMGRAFLTNQQPEIAVDCFQRALVLDPGVAEIHYKLATTLAQLGRPAEAIAQYSKALQLNPDLDDAANDLAWLLATCADRSLRNGAKAVALTQQASEHAHDQNPVLLGTLAAAYAEMGRLSEAAATAQRARQLALAQNNKNLASILESQWQRYNNGSGGSPR